MAQILSYYYNLPSLSWVKAPGQVLPVLAGAFYQRWKWNGSLNLNNLQSSPL